MSELDHLFSEALQNLDSAVSAFEGMSSLLATPKKSGRIAGFALEPRERSEVFYLDMGDHELEEVARITFTLDSSRDWTLRFEAGSHELTHGDSGRLQEGMTHPRYSKLLASQKHGLAYQELAPDAPLQEAIFAHVFGEFLERLAQEELKPRETPIELPESTVFYDREPTQELTLEELFSELQQETVRLQQEQPVRRRAGF